LFQQAVNQYLLAADAVDGVSTILIIRRRTFLAFEKVAKYKSAQAFCDGEKTAIDKALHKRLTNGSILGRLSSGDLVKRVVALLVEHAGAGAEIDERESPGSKVCKVFYSLADQSKRHQSEGMDLLASLLSALPMEHHLLRELRLHFWTFPKDWMQCAGQFRSKRRRARNC
jgi:hypothetical protein